MEWYRADSIGWTHCLPDPICEEATTLCMAAGWCREYSRGFVSIPSRFQDVMATGSHCWAALGSSDACTRILSYSNPRVTHNGRPTGVPAGTSVNCTRLRLNNPDCDTDVARLITELAPQVARRRDSRSALGSRQLLPDRSVRSENGQYRLVYQADGNLVLYDNGDETALWMTHTGGTVPGQAILQPDGNFVVYDGDGAAVWVSGTSGNPGAYMVVQSDGNFVIFDSADQPIWSRITGSLLP